jgi:glycosyltransferase involved in cell wall biosynthesis
MLRVRCPWTLQWEKNPGLLAALTHPDIEYVVEKGVAADVEFLHTIPYHKVKKMPIVLHIEEMRSLFWKRRAASQPLGLPGFGAWYKVRRRLGTYSAIITHLRLTSDSIGRFFRSRRIGAKVRYVPLGIERQSDHHRPLGLVRFLFTNSHNGDPNNFYRRGGREVVTAFSRLRDSRKDAELVVVSPDADRLSLPDFVTVISRRLEEDELNRQFAAAHAFLLPSVDLHAHSVLRAMSHGCVPIVSDAPGLSEYVTDRETGLIVTGRLGRDCHVSSRGLIQSVVCTDTLNGEVAANLYRAMLEVMESVDRRSILSRQAAAQVRTQNSLEAWREGVGAVILHAAGGSRPIPRPWSRNR